MKPHPLIVFSLIFSLSLMLVSNAPATVMINGVPDWNQPYTYVPPGPDPNLVALTDPFDNWCSPVAAANLFGWWEDIRGRVGLTDRAVFPASPAYPNNGAQPLFNQGLWHDGTIELGWFMDTNSWASSPGPNGWPNLGGGTQLGAIAPGGQTYAQSSWVDATTGIQKVGYTTNIRTLSWLNVPGNDAMTKFTNIWNHYVADIDTGIPLLVSFETWVNPASGVPLNDGFGTFLYQFNPQLSMGHTVTGVGYVDPIPGMIDGGELFVVHDNWGTTVMNVAVPLFALWTGNPATSTSFWNQNDHFDVVPEPCILLIAILGIPVFLYRRKRI